MYSSLSNGREFYRFTPLAPEDQSLCTFPADDRDGNDWEDGGKVDKWVLNEIVEDKLKSHEGDNWPLSWSGLHSSSEGTMSLISEASDGDKEDAPRSSSSATNLMDSRNLHLGSSSLEAHVFICVLPMLQDIACCYCVVREASNGSSTCFHCS